MVSEKKRKKEIYRKTRKTVCCAEVKQQQFTYNYMATKAEGETANRLLRFQGKKKKKVEI